MNRKILWITFILILVLTPGCGRKKAKNTAVEAIPVKVTSVTSGDIKENFITTGTVEAVESASISSKVSGRVLAVRVRLGDHVSKGQTLVSLDKEDFNHQLNQAKATLAQAEVNFKQSRDNFNRKQKLFTQQIISQQEFDAAQNEMEIAATQLKQAQVGIAMIETQLRNTEIQAPINGFIGRRMVNEGEMVSPGVPLIELVDLSRVYITVNLSDSYITQVTRGQKVQVSITTAPKRYYHGTVYHISPVADPETKTFPVKIILDNTSNVFKEGMLAEVRMNFNEKHNVLKIPVDAVIDEIGTKSVYVIKGKKAVRTIVEVGVSDGKTVEIISGLTASDKVVTLGQNNLEDGSKVVVK